jgi:hypothetical protein
MPVETPPRRLGSIQENLEALIAILAGESPDLFEAEEISAALLHTVHPESCVSEPATISPSQHEEINNLRRILWDQEARDSMPAIAVIDANLEILDASARMDTYIELLSSEAGNGACPELIQEAEGMVLDLIVSQGYEPNGRQADNLLAVETSLETTMVLLPYLCPEPPLDTFGNPDHRLRENLFASILDELECELLMGCRLGAIESNLEALRLMMILSRDQGDNLLRGDEKTAQFLRVSKDIQNLNLSLDFMLKRFLVHAGIHAELALIEVPSTF